MSQISFITIVDAFEELTDKIMQFISNAYLCYSTLALLCKFNTNIQNGCQDIANLLRRIFNVGH